MDFSNIHLDLSKGSGVCRFADSGIKWALSSDSGTVTFKTDNLEYATWSRAALGYQLRLITRDNKVSQLDGFEEGDFERISKYMKRNSVPLNSSEHSARGFNWGKTDFSQAELIFKVANKPAFEIPYAGIANVNISGKNEVAVELASQLAGVKEEKNKGSKELRTQNVSKNVDQLVEIRFYVPGTVVKPSKDGEDEDDDNKNNKDEEDGELEEENAANLFYRTLMEKADVANVLGDKVASFKDILHLTPRGRFDIDLFKDDFRLRGKTYDYKIRYDAIKKFMLLPKPDDLHTMITIGIDPPIRQGQTRYPFIVMQFKNDDEVPNDFRIAEETLEEERFKGKLQINYEMSLSACVASVFKDLSGKKVIAPSRDFSSHHQHSGVKCSIKANEGHLFCLDRSLMFVPKPATYVSFDHVESITFSRVGTAVTAGRTFDMTVTLRDGSEHQFSNINREEQSPLSDFLRSKNIRVKNNVVDDDAGPGMKMGTIADLAADFDDDTDESDATASIADSDSDMSDSDDDGSDGGVDENDMDDGDEDGDDEDEDDRPKKKSKTK